MRTLRHLVALGLGAAALSACSPARPSHDKGYFAAHETERASTLAACRNDPGAMTATPSCVNAEAAEGEARTKSFYDVPPPASRVTKPGSL